MLAVIRTMCETTGVAAGVVTAPPVVEVWPRWVSPAGGVSVTVYPAALLGASPGKL